MKKIFTKISLLCIGLMLCAGNAWGQEQESNPIAIYDGVLPTGVSYEIVCVSKNVMNNCEKYVLTFTGAGVIPANPKDENGDAINFRDVLNTLEGNDVFVVEFGEGITSIGAGLFNYPYSDIHITDVYCKRTNLPTVASNTFHEYFKTDVRLHVPSIDTYADWGPQGENQKFMDIVSPINSSATAGTSGTDFTWELVHECNCPVGTTSMAALGAYGLLLAAYSEDPSLASDLDFMTSWTVVMGKAYSMPSPTVCMNGYTYVSDAEESKSLTFTQVENTEGNIPDYEFNSAPWEGCVYDQVLLPEGVKRIGSYTFRYSFDYATIPSSVIEIDKEAFYPATLLRMTPKNGATFFTDYNTIDYEYHNGQILDITINRPAQMGNQYNTICLPFSMNETQIANSSLADAEIYKFSNAAKDGDYLDLHFQPVTTMEAGVPYFFRIPTNGDNLTNLTFEDVTISNTTPQDVTHNGVTLHGTLSQVTISGSGKLYLAAGNNLKYYDGYKTINPFRAYFEVAGITPNYAPKARIVAHENATTGVEDVAAEVKAVKFVENGQILIKRGEAVYNLQGQVVK